MKSKRKQRLAVLVVCALLTSVFPVGNPVTGKAASETGGLGGYGLNNPVTNGSGVVTWDCVWLGNYWQEDTNGDGRADQNDLKQPIKWRVLSVNGNDAILLADKNLDVQRYNDTYTSVTWETSTIRSWLNGYGAGANIAGKDYSSNNFFVNAFSESEQSAIQITNVVNNDNPELGTEGGNNTSDQVYLLSLDEVKTSGYGFLSDDIDINEVDKSKIVKNTEYAKMQGAYSAGLTISLSTEYVGNGPWWLRSPGRDSYNASFVNASGRVSRFGFDVDDIDVGVRPALHLNLSSASSWSYAGTVTSDGKENEAATLVPGDVLKVTTNTPSAKKETSSVGKVSSLKLKQKNHNVTISWKRVSKATDYQICYSTSKKWKNKKLKLTKKNKLTIKKLKKKKTYYFRVRAYQTKGKSKTYGPWSAVKKITMKK